jgi:UDP-N-acetylmuramoyl-tripeptide--D-alanyl-D-alanine ligase
VKLPVGAAIAATGAELHHGENAPRKLRISTDTRTLEPGDTFVALRGERYDGHAYVHEAIAKGAALIVVDDAEARVEGVPTLIVGDTFKAYTALAGLARARFEGSVLAITGSAGKTTTKVLVSQLLSLRYGDRVLGSPANENNEIGVSKLLLSASRSQHDVLVVEMGARHYGDIATLVAIARPNVGVLTNVGDAHLEIMGSRERLEETKWAIFESAARPIVNASDPTTIARAPQLARSPHWFFAGASEAMVPVNGRVTAIVGSHELVDTADGHARSIAIDVRLPGAHNHANLAAAIAASTELGVDLDEIAEAIPQLQLPSGRYERIALANGVTLIYDAYNANAAGMMAALDAFADERASRRIALLSSMAELGDEAPELHARVGAHAAATNVDVMLVGGDFAGALASGAARGGLSSERIVPFASNEDAARWVREHARPGDAVLLKGSRRYRLEEIVDDLRGSEVS